MVDLVIKGAAIIDGSGKREPIKADILVEGDRIEDIGNFNEVEANIVIDAEGKTVSPGFIDMHSHADMTLPFAPYAESLVHMGVTTVVTGQCGISPAPISPEYRQVFIESFGTTGKSFNWDLIHSFGSFLDLIEKQGISVNMEPLVGHGTIRTAVMGFSDQKPTQDQLNAMQRYVEQAMEEGAIGISTGLIYPPGIYSDTDELIEVTRPVGKRGGIYFSHVRDESEHLLDSIEEELKISHATGAAIQHSHYKASGEANWSLAEKGLEAISKARANGVDMTIDMYPYIASSNSLIDSLPDWSRVGGLSKTIERLKDPAERKRMRNDMGVVRWEKNLISGSPKVEHVGRYVADLAAEAGKDPYEWVFDVLIETHGDVARIAFGMSEENVRMQIQHELMMIGTDGYSIPLEGLKGEAAPHPRSFGTFARVLGKYAREEKILSLEQAIWKMTGFPAQKLGLGDRGLILKGNKADLVVFDQDTIIDKATFVQPLQYAQGVEQVLVNGQLVLRDGKHTHALAGKILSR